MNSRDDGRMSIEIASDRREQRGRHRVGRVRSEAQSDVFIDCQRIDGAACCGDLLIGVTASESDELMKHARGHPGFTQQRNNGEGVRRRHRSARFLQLERA